MKKTRSVFISCVVSAACCAMVISCGGGGGGGTSWFHPQNIDDYRSFDGSSVNIVQVAMNAVGDAVLVWDQSDATYNRIYMAEREGATGMWTWPAGSAEYINPDGTSAATYSPVVAMDDDGNAIIAWTQPDMAASSWIFASVKDAATGSWTHPSSLSDHVAASVPSAGVSVAMADSGKAIAAWQHYYSAGTIHVAFSEMSAPGGTWSAPMDLHVSVPIAGMEIIGGPSAGLGDSGEAIVAWQQFQPAGSSYLFYCDREASSTTWNLPVTAADSIAVGASSTLHRLDMAPNGNVVVTWYEDIAGTDRIFAAWREGSTGSWTFPSAPSDSLSLDSSNARFSRAAANSSGDAVVIWRQFDGSGYDQIFMSERDGSTGLWDNPDDLDDNISPDGTNAAERNADMAESGHTVIIWHQNISGGYGIFISERTGSGSSWIHPAALSDRINPDGGDSTRTPYVAVGGNGTAVLAWRQVYGGYDRLYISEKR